MKKEQVKVHRDKEGIVTSLTIGGKRFMQADSESLEARFDDLITVDIGKLPEGIEFDTQWELPEPLVYITGLSTLGSGKVLVALECRTYSEGDYGWMNGTDYLLALHTKLTKSKEFSYLSEVELLQGDRVLQCELSVEAKSVGQAVEKAQAILHAVIASLYFQLPPKRKKSWRPKSVPLSYYLQGRK